MAKRNYTTPVLLRTAVCNEYSDFLVEQLESWDQVIPLITLLETATENDCIYLTIGGVGGAVNLAAALIEAITRTPATVVGKLRGTSCASAHSMILLACDYIDIGVGSRMMIHTYTGGAFGTGAGNIRRDSESLDFACAELLERVARGFLTEEELTHVKEHNHDMYFVGSEIPNRVASLYKYRMANNLVKRGVDYTNAQVCGVSTEDDK